MNKKSRAKIIEQRKLLEERRSLGANVKAVRTPELTELMVETQCLAELVFAALAEKAQQAAEALVESGDSLREQGSLVTLQLEAAGKVLAEIPTRRMLFPASHWSRVIESSKHLVASMRRYARRQDVFRSCVDELVQFVKTGSAAAVSSLLGKRCVTVPLDAVARTAMANQYHVVVMRVGTDSQQDMWSIVLGCWREKDPSTVPGARASGARTNS